MEKRENVVPNEKKEEVVKDVVSKQEKKEDLVAKKVVPKHKKIKSEKLKHDFSF